MIALSFFFFCIFYTIGHWYNENRQNLLYDKYSKGNCGTKLGNYGVRQGDYGINQEV